MTSTLFKKAAGAAIEVLTGNMALLPHGLKDNIQGPCCDHARHKPHHRAGFEELHDLLTAPQNDGGMR